MVVWNPSIKATIHWTNKYPPLLTVEPLADDGVLHDEISIGAAS